MPPSFFMSLHLTALSKFSAEIIIDWVAECFYPRNNKLLVERDRRCSVLPLHMLCVWVWVCSSVALDHDSFWLALKPSFVSHQSPIFGCGSWKYTHIWSALWFLLPLVPSQKVLRWNIPHHHAPTLYGSLFHCNGYEHNPPVQSFPDAFIIKQSGILLHKKHVPFWYPPKQSSLTHSYGCMSLNKILY